MIVRLRRTLSCDTMRSGVVLALAVFLVACCAGQELPRQGLDVPRVRVVVAGFDPIGVSADTAQRVSKRLQSALDAHPLIEVISSKRAQEAALDAADGVLAQKRGAARALGDSVGIDAVVYGRLINSIDGVVGEAPQLETGRVQIVVVETLTLRGELYPSVPMAVEDFSASVDRIAALTVRLLPAVGRVLSIIDSPAGVTIELFPLGGRVLASDAEYGVYDPVEFHVAVDELGESSKPLARQHWRPALLTGRVQTATERADHTIAAASIDAGGHVSVGQLVGLLPDGGNQSHSLPTSLLLVNSLPLNSVVFVNGGFSGLTPVGIDLSTVSQQFTVKIAKKHYLEQSYQISREGEQRLAMSTVLREVPPFGDLRVTTKPEGARATLDGEPLGSTPLEARQLPVGEHDLVVTLDGYKQLTRRVQIERQKMTELSFELERDLCRVTVNSRPEGARVQLDGEDVGRTPLDLGQLQAGRHQLRLSLAGHAPLAEEVVIKSGAGENVLNYRLRPLAGNLRVETTPPGATVTVDGKQEGTTPTAITGMSIGQHEITLNADDYLPIRKTVTIRDQRTTLVQEALRQAKGQIRCFTVPPGATIFIDGQQAGTTPKTLTDVPVGKHVITLKLKGYRDWTGKALVVEGKTTDVQVAPIRAEMDLQVE